jgi:hypothetical protein
MNKVKEMRHLLLVVATSALAFSAHAQQNTQPAPPAAQPATAQSGQGLVIENDSPLPDTYPQARYEVRLNAQGGVPPLHWRIERGTLPSGVKLEEDGLLHGQPENTGEFQFTASAVDGGQPQLAVQKAFVVRVRSGLIVNWKAPARVNGNRIDGSVEVTNTTPDDMDLTFDVKAVAENGRAVEIGYQRFALRRGTIAKELPFGEMLPHGGYVIYVNVNGEVAAKHLIDHERMQTPGPLQVTVGP